MIKYNNNTINDWNFGDDNIIKVYKNNAVCYYKVSVGDTAQTPCYAVVDDISQYQDTEFEDVYDNATDKWYKLNNLNTYEEYGIYGSGRTITTYEGKLTIDDGYEYIYSGGSWVNIGEVSGGTATLPDVPFTLNYNAKNYDSQTKTLFKTSGQLADVDAVISNGTPTANNDYLTITSNTLASISGYQNYFNRSNTTNNRSLTIISKQLTDGKNCHLLANRTNAYNWMYRAYSDKLTLHGRSEQGGVAITTQPAIVSVRVDYNGSNTIATYNNYTDKTTSAYTAFTYGDENTSGAVGLFAGYSNAGNSEYFIGDFYWIYMSQSTLTDEQVQQVIAYNEGGGGQPIYPLEYVVREDPPNNLTFSSMTEAEAYECPWVGMQATIDGSGYTFSGDSQSGYEWVYNSSRLPQGYTEVEYIENTGTSYINTNFIPNQDTRVVCDMQRVTTDVKNNGRMWGSGMYKATDGLMIDFEGGYLKVSWFGKTGWTVYNSVVADNNRHIFDLNKNSIYVDNTLIGNNTYTVQTASDNMAVFVYIANGEPAYSSSAPENTYFVGKMFSFKVYNNGTLVRDLVPCINPSNVVGAYDIVNDVFYTVPSGYTTDTFVAGNPI